MTKNQSQYIRSNLLIIKKSPCLIFWNNVFLIFINIGTIFAFIIYFLPVFICIIIALHHNVLSQITSDRLILQYINRFNLTTILPFPIFRSNYFTPIIILSTILLVSFSYLNFYLLSYTNILSYSCLSYPYLSYFYLSYSYLYPVYYQTLINLQLTPICYHTAILILSSIILLSPTLLLPYAYLNHIYYQTLIYLQVTPIILLLISSSVILLSPTLLLSYFYILSLLSSTIFL